MPERTIVILANRLVEGTGRPPVENAAIVVENGRIAAVGPRGEVTIPKNTEVIDLGQRTLLPGLIDAHVHFYMAAGDNMVLRSIEPSQRKLIRAVGEASRLLNAGFTAARDMGYGDAVYLKQAIEAGEVPGPRLATPRFMIVQTGGSPDPHWLPREYVVEFDYRCRLADGIAEVQQAAREQIRGGADFLKIMASGGLGERHGLEHTYHYTLPELEAIVEEGHKLGLKVAAHAIGAPAVKNAVLAGVDTIEHGSYVDDEALDLMAEHDVIFIPTLGIMRAFAAGAQGAARDRAAEVLEAGMERVARARARGIRIAAGTDFGGVQLTKHGRNAIEAELLVEAGMPPHDAIVATTVRGAEAMDRARDIGTLEPGKAADVTATPGNPLEDIRALQQIDFVMKGGAVVRGVGEGVQPPHARG